MNKKEKMQVFKQWCKNWKNPLTPEGKEFHLIKENYALEIIITDEDFFGNTEQKMFTTLRKVTKFVENADDKDQMIAKALFKEELLEFVKAWNVTYCIGFIGEYLNDTIEEALNNEA